MPRNSFLFPQPVPLEVLNSRRDAIQRFHQRMQNELGFVPRPEQPEEVRREPEAEDVDSFNEAFVPRRVGGRVVDSYYNQARSNQFVNQLTSGAYSVHPLAGWLTNAIGAGLVAGVSSVNPYVGLLAGGASLISGLPSLWSGFRERRAQQERAERERRRNDALNEASAGVKQLNERYSSLMQTLQGLGGNTNAVNSNPELTAERVNEGRVMSDAERKAQAVTDPIRRYNNLQIQRAASFSVFPIPPIVPKRALVRPTAPDRRLVRPMGAGFFSIL